MEPFDLGRALAEVPELVIRKDATSEAEAAAAMRVLADFNQCMAGLVRFSGQTPWERHPDDELLHILEGEVRVTVLGASETRCLVLSAGQIFVVPRGHWHRQETAARAALLFITSRDGNEASEADDPRAA